MDGKEIAVQHYSDLALQFVNLQPKLAYFYKSQQVYLSQQRVDEQVQFCSYCCFPDVIKTRVQRLIKGQAYECVCAKCMQCKRSRIVEKRLLESKASQPHQRLSPSQQRLLELIRSKKHGK